MPAPPMSAVDSGKTGPRTVALGQDLEPGEPHVKPTQSQDSTEAQKRFDSLLQQLSLEYSLLQAQLPNGALAIPTRDLTPQVQCTMPAARSTQMNGRLLQTRGTAPRGTAPKSPVAQRAHARSVKTMHRDAPPVTVSAQDVAFMPQFTPTGTSSFRLTEDASAMRETVLPGTSGSGLIHLDEGEHEVPTDMPDIVIGGSGHAVRRKSSLPKAVNDILTNSRAALSVKAITDVKDTALRRARTSMVGEQALSLQKRVAEMLNASKFDTIMGFVIVANSIEIGMESSYRLNNVEVPAFPVMEWFFLITYTVELAMRLFAFGLECFRSNWVKFDASLVVVGILGSILEPILEKSEDSGSILGPVMVLRVFRLFRLARAVRLLVQFRTLWLLLQGLFSAASTIFYTFTLLLIILYVFSCMAMELITIPWSTKSADINPEVKMLVDQYWPNLWTSMLSLVQFVFLDSIGAIYSPMIHDDLKLLCFFVPFLLIVSIALMNLVTAVIVEGSLSQANLDKEEQLSRMIPVLHEAFQQLDIDNSGKLNKWEVQQVSEKGAQYLATYLGSNSLVDLFDIIDVDKSGEIDIEEFCDGIARLTKCGKPIEFYRILTHVYHLEALVEGVSEDINVLSQRLPQLGLQSATAEPLSDRVGPSARKVSKEESLQI